MALRIFRVDFEDVEVFPFGLVQVPLGSVKVRQEKPGWKFVGGKVDGFLQLFHGLAVHSFHVIVVGETVMDGGGLGVIAGGLLELHQGTPAVAGLLGVKGVA